MWRSRMFIIGALLILATLLVFANRWRSDAEDDKMTNVDIVPPPSNLPPVIMLASSRTTWENGFVVNEVLKGYSVTVRFYNGNKKVVSSKDPAWAYVQPNSQVPVVLTIDGPATPCSVAKWMFANLRPTVTFLLSDEFNQTKCIHDAAGAYGGLVLRQYSSVRFGYKQYPNVPQMILGTMSGMMDNIPEAVATNLTKSTDRSLKWLFIGTKKSDRTNMVNTLIPLQPNVVRWSTSKKSTSKQDSATMTMDAVFAPNGRGWVTLDCFRLYEASRLGAIPVVVGTSSEIDLTFKHMLGYEEKLPPWVYALTWKEALVEMKKLLSNSDALLEKQHSVIEFWKLTSGALAQRVRLALDKK